MDKESNITARHEDKKVFIEKESPGKVEKITGHIPSWVVWCVVDLGQCELKPESNLHITP